MRLLVLSINYTPEPTGFAHHVAALCEHLAARGHAVRVITGFQFAPRWARSREDRRRFWRCEPANGVEVTRVTHYIPRAPRRVGERVLMEASFCATALLSLLRFHPGRPDAILYVGAQPALAMLARLLARLWLVPYGILVTDLAAQAARDVGLVKSPGIVEALQRFEYAAYRKASAAIVLCASFKTALAAEGFPIDRIELIPSPVDLETIRPLARNPLYRARHSLGPDDFVVLYAGSMGRKQSLTTVVKAAGLLRNSDRNIKWVLVGDGELRPVLARMIAVDRLEERVRLWPFQAESELASMLSCADALLLAQQATVRDTVVPSKLLTYMAAGRAILAAVHPSSQAADILRRSGGGVLVPPDNPGALAEVVRAVRRNPPLLHNMGRLNRQYAEAHFEKQRVLAAQEFFLATVLFRSDAAVCRDSRGSSVSVDGVRL